MKIALILTLFFSFISCVTPMIPLRSFNDRAYRPCEKFEVEDGSNVGKLCYRYCTKYKFLHADISSNCVIWKTDIKDFNDPETFASFKAGKFVMVSESYLK